MIDYNAGYNAAVESLRICVQSLMDEMATLKAEREQLARELDSAERTSTSLLDGVERLTKERDDVLKQVATLTKAVQVLREHLRRATIRLTRK